MMLPLYTSFYAVKSATLLNRKVALFRNAVALTACNDVLKRATSLLPARHSRMAAASDTRAHLLKSTRLLFVEVLMRMHTASTKFTSWCSHDVMQKVTTGSLCAQERTHLLNVYCTMYGLQLCLHAICIPVSRHCLHKAAV